MSIDKIKKGDALSQSADLISENIAKLKELFPNVVTEGKIDFKVLQDILGDDIEEGEEYYRFTWAGKAQARREAHKPSTGTLRPCKEESVNWDSTENLYIEGDNLEVLKLLQKSYNGKVKMISIDPPYNTGKDFVYKDNYKDNLRNYQELSGQIDSDGNKLTTNTESDGHYHSNWCNMIYPRLILARNLLKEDGVIFINIDDNEVENLRKIADEIFGEENFVGSFCVKSTPNARDYGHIGKMHEYCLFYVKDLFEAETFLIPDEDKTFRYEDEIGGYNIHPLYNSNEAFHKGNRKNLYYPFYINLDEKIGDDGFFKISLEKLNNSVEVYPPLSNKNSVQFVWRWGVEKSKANLNKEILGYQTSEGEFRIVQKMRTSSKVIRSIIDSKGVSSRRGTAEVEGIFDKKLFSFPKPIELIKNFVQCGSGENDLILDFFSGSATTAHAVMQLNAEDGGSRKHIMVQLPEPTDEKSEANKAGYKTIAEIGKERIRRAGKKIVEEQSEALNKLKAKGSLLEEDKAEIVALQQRIEKLDIGFKVFKLDSSNIKEWDGSSENLEQSLFDSQDNIKTERTEEDVLYEILLKYGLDLTMPIEQKVIEGATVFNIGMGALFICLANGITNKIAEGIGAWHEELKPEHCRVVFKDTGFTDVEKTNSVQTLKRFGIHEIKSI